MAQPGLVGDLGAVVEPQAAGVLKPPGAGVIDHLQHQGVRVQDEVQGQDLPWCAGMPGEHYLVTVRQKSGTVTQLQRHLVITTEQGNAPHQAIVS